MAQNKSREAMLQSLRDRTPISGAQYERAQAVLPGGLSSGARRFEPHPFYADRAAGSKMWDIDGNEYLDLCMSYGVLLLGHRHPVVMEAIQTQSERGLIFGAPHNLEVEFVEKLVDCIPCADMMLLCNSGTEATMQGIRVMRAYTGKTKIAKFEGGYHGWHDYALWSYIIKPEKMGPLDKPALVPNSAGIPDEIKETLLLLPNTEAAFGLIEEHASDLAGVMIEPVNGVGTLPTDPAFLQGLSEVTKRTGVPLMFDEVVTGFRFALGGAQEYYGVIPDIATYGKAIGGGFPIGAVGCSREMLEHVVNSDLPISVAGTFSGNPMSLAAGNATIDFLIQNPQIYVEMAAKGESLRSSFNEFARRKGLPGTMTGVASLSQVHLREPPINNLRDLLEQDFDALRDFQLHLRYNGVFTPGFHWACLSAVHSEQDIERAVEAHQVSLEGCLSKS